VNGYRKARKSGGKVFSGTKYAVSAMQPGQGQAA
jgi:hypothetical protein